MADNDAEFPGGLETIDALSFVGSSRRVLASEALRSVLSLKELEHGPKNRGVVVVEVPSSAWLAEMVAAASKVWANSFVGVLGFDKRTRNLDEETYLKHAADGEGVVIITQSAERHVPKAFRIAARLTVTVSMPNRSSLIHVAQKLVIGNARSALKGLAMERLDFDTFCMCVTPGLSAKESALRISTALAQLSVSTANTDIPGLKDAQGYGTAVMWAADLVNDLAAYRKGSLPWSEVSSGALLHGIPGTGKTLFAQICAKATGLPLVMTSVANYFAQSSGYLDGVIKYQRQVFDEASAAAPCILFIDELDALPKRSAAGRNQDFWLPVITDFLTLLDSAMFDREGIVVMGATNRIDAIDDAILREGRLGTVLEVSPPDPASLLGILKFHLGDDLKDQDLMQLVVARKGATGADAVAWAKAARRIARTENRPMAYNDLASVMLPPSNGDPAERYRIAIHESGHTIAAIVMNLAIESVTIVPNGQNAGTTSFSPSGRMVLTKSQLADIVVAILAGRAAEIVVLGDEPSTAAGGNQSSDLAQATVRIAEWHTALGMGSKLTWNLGGMGALDIQVRDAIEADLQRLQNRAIEIIRSHKPFVEAVARALVERQVLTIDQVLDLNPTVRASGQSREARRRASKTVRQTSI